MAERFIRRHLQRLQLTAAQLARAGLLTEQLAAELAEARTVLWVLQGGPPDA